MEGDNDVDPEVTAMFDATVYYQLSLRRGNELIAEAEAFRLGRMIRARRPHLWPSRSPSSRRDPR